MAVQEKSPSLHVAIIGAGPSGLTAAYLLARQGIDVTVFEEDELYVGGRMRTVNYKGFRFDPGRKSFYSKSDLIRGFWEEIFPQGFLSKEETSQIYCRGKLFSLPLSLRTVAQKLRGIESIRCLWSYLGSKFNLVHQSSTLENPSLMPYGYRIFSLFLKTYAEKKWGQKLGDMEPDDIGVETRDDLISNFRSKKKLKHVDPYLYPRLGSGQAWEECAEEIRNLGGIIHLGQKVRKIRWSAGKNRWKITSFGRSQAEKVTLTHQIISSVNIRELCEILHGQMSLELVEESRFLTYRNQITVGLIAREPQTFLNHSVEVHDASVKVARIHNFKEESQAKVPNHSYCSYGLEYFCFEGDGMWESSNDQLIDRAQEDMERLGFGTRADFVDGIVIRQKKAFPCQAQKHQKTIAAIRAHLKDQFPRLHLVGLNEDHLPLDQVMLNAKQCADRMLVGNVERRPRKSREPRERDDRPLDNNVDFPLVEFPWKSSDPSEIETLTQPCPPPVTHPTVL